MPTTEEVLALIARARDAAATGTGEHRGPARWIVPHRDPPHMVLTGHVGGVSAEPDGSGPVTALAFLAGLDGRPMLAGNTGSGGVRLWDPEDGAEIGPLAETHGTVAALGPVPTPDGRTLLALGAADKDGGVQLWDPATNELVRRVATGSVGQLATLELPGGRVRLATAAPRGGPVRLWDPGTGEPVGEVLADSSGPIVSLPRPDGGMLLATKSAYSFVALWDPATGTRSGPLIALHPGWLETLAAVAQPDGRALLVTAGEEGTVLWDPDTGAAVGPPLADHAGTVVAVVAVSLPDGGTVIAAGSDDGTLRLRDAGTGKCRRVLPLDTPVRVLAAQGQQLAVGCRHGVLLLDVAALGADSTPQLPEKPAAAAGTAGTPAVLAALDDIDDRWRLRWSPVPIRDGGTLLASAGADTTVRIWDPDIHPLARAEDAGPVRALAFVPQPDGRLLLAAAAWRRRVLFWDADTGESAGEAPGYGESVRAVAAVPLPDGRTVVAVDGAEQLVGDDHAVWLYDPFTRATSPPFTGHYYWVTDLVAWRLPDGQTALAVGCFSNKEPDPRWDPEYADDLRLWNPVTGTEIGTAPPAFGGALAQVPLPDGRTVLATQTPEHALLLWDPVAGAATAGLLTGHTGTVHAMTAVQCPDGRTLLASGGADRTVRLWDPLTGAGAGELTGHTGSVSAVATVELPGGDPVLVSGARDGTLRLWDPMTAVCGSVLRLGSPILALAAHESRLAVGCEAGALALDLADKP